MRTLRTQKKGDDEPVYLTAEGIRRMHERLARLKQSVPAMVEEAQRTAAFGDRSENAEYKEAKGTLRRTYRQIFNLEDQLKRVVEIKAGTGAAGTVRIGSTVKVESKNGVVRTFQILGSHETNPDKGRISFKSPLGAALISRTQGETVTIQTPAGPQEYRIIEVS